MNAAQEAANKEGKSSAGDKYETTRALMQRERAQVARQLAEGIKLQKALSGMAADKVQQKVEPGALVKVKQGWFYFSVGLGKIVVEGKNLFAISGASPVGQAMAGKSAGESYTFNGRDFEIEEVY